MFLLLSGFVIILIFWLSAIIAEIAMDSEEENSLAPSIRVGLSYVLTSAFFGGAWTIFSMSQTWIFSIVFLSILIYGKYGFSRIAKVPIFFKSLFKTYLRAFFGYIVGAIIFFAPLLISGNYGPFTESGGDITIYADSAKLLTDRGMTSIGQEKPTLSDIKNNLAAIFDLSTIERFKKFAPILDPFQEKYSDRMNPPAGDADVNRLINRYRFSSIHYSPYAQYYFLQKDTNYPVFFGIHAFLYSCILVGIWFFFANFGKKLAIAATAITTASHGLISVHYNVYSLQVMAIAISALFLATLFSIRLFSMPGFRTYIPGIIITISCYIHFLSVIAPLIFIAGCAQFLGILKDKVSSSLKSQSQRHKYTQWVSFSIVSLFFLLCFMAGADHVYSFLRRLMPGISGAQAFGNFGVSIPAFSQMWLSFLFGTLSQQHFYPFAIEIPSVMMVVKMGTISGVIAFLMGALLMIRASRTNQDFFLGRKNFYLLFYGVLILTIILQLLVATSSLYVQAKGSQNILLIVYTTLLLPLAVVSNHNKEDKFLSICKRILGGSLIVFFIALLIPRVVYTTKIAFNSDRASTLETSYFSEAKKIHELDPHPFVLFEPRKSADLYLSAQPFFDDNFISTRDLVIQIIPRGSRAKRGKAVLGSELIKPKDIPHLWLLRAQRLEKSPILGIDKYKWEAEKLTEQEKPRIILFADNYEENFGERPLEPPKSTGMFSYLRNGAAMLYLPAGFSGELEVTLESRDGKNYSSLAKEINLRAKNGEFGKEVAIEKTGKFVKLKYNFPYQNSASLKTIARYKSEFWLNVRINGNEF